MSIFAISDLHLSNAPSVVKPMDIFGDRWFNHADRIKNNWLETVSEEDTVIMPGDISWGLKLEEALWDLDWINNLPGHKLIIKGNHDLWWSGINRMNKLFDKMSFMQNDSFSIEGLSICGSRGWITPDDEDFTAADDKIYRRELLRMETSLRAAEFTEKIVFMHYPPVSVSESFSGFQQLFEDYSVREVYYGHVHGSEGFSKAIQGNYHGVNYSLISADYLNCKPIKIR